MKWFRREHGGAWQNLLLFGGGLIGSAIKEAVQKQARWQANELPWSWRDADERRRQREALLRLVGEGRRVDLVWAAGISGFGSSDEDMRAETAHVAEILRLAQDLRARSDMVVLHLFSSMGALFEGQSWIDAATEPRPLRPYGAGKLAQEALVAQPDRRIVGRIYRPSSVYGYARNGRHGFFVALIGAMLANRPAVIFGSPQTLRDYVFSRDIGEFVAAVLAQPLPVSGKFLLASGKPTSLVEAVSSIEKLIGRRYYGRFDRTPHNALDMTVRPRAVPTDLGRTPLKLGMAFVHQAMRDNLVCNNGLQPNGHRGS